MAFKQQLVVLSYLVLQSAGDANASSRLRGANSSVEGGMARVLTNFTSSTKSGLAAKSAKQPEWTAWFSDEGWGSASCNGLISGMECSGRYCDSVRLGCDYSLGSDHVSSRWKGWFSDTSESLCDKGQFVTAVQCKGRYCDDLRLSCSSVPSTLVQSNCRWLGWFSDGSGKQVFLEGTRLTGLACTGRYCDDLRPYVCNVHQRCIAAGKQQGSWKYVETIANSGSKQYIYHSTERNSKSSSSEWSKSLTTSVSAGFEYMGLLRVLKFLRLWQGRRPEAWRRLLRRDMLRLRRTRSRQRVSAWDFGSSSSLLKTPAVTRNASRPTSSSTPMAVSGAHAAFQAMPWAFSLLTSTPATTKTTRWRPLHTADRAEMTGLHIHAMACRLKH